MSNDKSIVAAVRTTPETVLDDYRRVMELAGYQDVLKKDAQTILKNNISWHLLYPGANSTPWQVEGVAKTLIEDGYDDLVVVRHALGDVRTKRSDARPQRDFPERYPDTGLLF
jgi:hypothetical protein